MKFITKRQHPKPLADSNPWAARCKKTKQPKFKDKDLKRVAEFDIVLGLEPYSASWSEKYSSAYIAEEDDASSTGRILRQ